MIAFCKSHHQHLWCRRPACIVQPRRLHHNSASCFGICQAINSTPLRGFTFAAFLKGLTVARFLLHSLVAATILSITLASTIAQTKSIGSIERLDPAFDKLVPQGAAIEVLGEGFDWAEGC